MLLCILNDFLVACLFLKAVSVRLVKDKDGRLKGFGYAEFDAIAGLMDALSLKGTVSRLSFSIIELQFANLLTCLNREHT